jgi:hypothetical protein
LQQSQWTSQRASNAAVPVIHWNAYCAYVTAHTITLCDTNFQVDRADRKSLKLRRAALRAHLPKLVPAVLACLDSAAVSAAGGSLRSARALQIEALEAVAQMGRFLQVTQQNNPFVRNYSVYYSVYIYMYASLLKACDLGHCVHTSVLQLAHVSATEELPTCSYAIIYYISARVL